MPFILSLTLSHVFLIAGPFIALPIVLTFEIDTLILGKATTSRERTIMT